MGWKDVANKASGDPAFVETLKAALAGDTAAHGHLSEWLVTNAQEALQEFVQKKFHHTENTARDVVQDSFIAIWNAVREGRGAAQPPDEFFDWLWRIAYQNSLYKKRQKKSTPFAGSGALVDPATGHQTRLERKEQVGRLKNALPHLTRSQQEIAAAYLEHPDDWIAIGEKLGRSSEGARVEFHSEIRPVLRALVKTAVLALPSSGRMASWDEIDAAIEKTKMNRQYAEILRLRLHDGLAVEDVAKRLKLTPAATDKICGIARAMVKGHLAGDLPSPRSGR